MAVGVAGAWFAGHWAQRNRSRGVVAVAGLAAYGGAGIWLSAGTGPNADLVALSASRPSDFGWLPAVGLATLTVVAARHVIELAEGRRLPVGLPDLASSLMFLPGLLAGPVLEPVDRAGTVRRHATLADVDAGLKLIAIALVAKLALTDPLSDAVQALFARDASIVGTRDAWIMAAMFGLQFYGEFAAWLLAGLGVARVLGVALNDAWSFPLIASTPHDFWRRWHPSLMRVLRPVPSESGLFAYMTVVAAMVVAGLWIGFGPQYLAWGLYQGACLAAWTWLASTGAGRWGARLPAPVRLTAGGIATLATVWLGGLLLRASSLEQGLRLIGRALWPLSAPASLPLDHFAVQMMAITGLLVLAAAVAPRLTRWHKSRPAKPASTIATVLGGAVCGACIVTAIAFWPVR